MIAPNIIQTMFGSNAMAGFSKTGKTGAGNGEVPSAFAMLMGKHQSIGQSGGRNLLQGASSRFRAQIGSAGKKGNPGLTQQTGHARVAQLKQQLQAAGVSLDQVVTDSQALGNLEKLLVGAGFDAGQIKSLLSELSANAGGKGFRLSALFERVSQLCDKLPTESGGRTLLEDVLGEKSSPSLTQLKQQLHAMGVSLDSGEADDQALANLETLLVGAGVDADQIKSLLSDLTANAGGKGFRLSALFERVSQLGDKLPTESGGRTLLPGVFREGSTPGLSQLTGHALLAQLKQQLHSAGVSLDQVVADDQALANLETLLVGAGFDADQVKSLLGELTATAGGKGVRLSTLFEKISQLDEESPKEYAPEYLAISALPYLETILNQLGLGAEQTAGVLADAKIEGQGIDVMRLATGLKRLQAGAANQSNMAAVAGSRPQTLTMLQRIGLISAPGGSEDMDLDRLIMALEKRGQRTALLPDAGSNAAPVTRASIADQQPSPGLLSNLAESGFLRADAGPARFSETANPAAWGGEPGLASLSNGLSSAWDGFMQNIKAISGDKKGTLATGKALSRKFSKGQTMSTNASLETKGASGPPDGNEAPTDSEMNRPVGRAVNTLAVPGGSGGETGETLERSGRGAGAQSDSRSFGSVVASVEAGMKSDDPTTMFADGLTRRSAVAESAGDVPTRPAARPVPAYMLEQVSRQILRSRLLGENEIRLQLKPPSLGRLKMSIENTTNGLKVSIIAESPVARDMLMAHSNDLKHSLMGQGMQVDKIDVETQADFSQNMADARRESNRPGGRSRLSGGSASRADGGTDAVVDGPATAIENNDGMLNLVA